MGRRSKRMRAWRRSLRALQVAGVVLALGAVVSLARAQGPADPAETLKAVGLAQELWDDVIHFDREEEGVYSPEFVEKLTRFYRYGAGTQQNPGDPVVTRKFCRDYTLGLLRDLFLAERVASDNATLRSLTKRVHESSARLFRSALADILLTAQNDLSFIQRTRLYNLSGEVFSEEDANAIAALRMLARAPELGGGEESLILRTVERIENRAAPESTP